MFDFIFGNKLGPYVNRGAVIGAAVLGVGALCLGGLAPMVIFSFVGLFAGGIVGSFTEPRRAATQSGRHSSPQLKAADENARVEHLERHEDRELNHHDHYSHTHEDRFHRDRIDAERSHDRDEGHSL